MPDPQAKFQVGESVTQHLIFDEPAVRQFALLSGDSNPMHHDKTFAGNTRFGGLIASGAHSSAIMLGMVAAFMTERGASLGLEFSVKFRKAIPVDQPVRIEWIVEAIEPNPKLNGHIITLSGKLYNAQNEVAVEGHAKAASLPPDALLSQ